MKLHKISHLDLYLIITALAIRLLIAPFTKNPSDMSVWMSVGSAIFSGQNPYALPSNALVYPPLWGIFCLTSHIAFALTNNLLIFNFAIKLPIIIADILISLIIRKIVFSITNDAAKARRAIILYLFNPVTIAISSIWGMFDAIPTLFVLVAILYLLQNKNPKSGLFTGIGIAFKGFFPAFLLPLFLFQIWNKQKKVSECLSFIFFTLLVPILVSIPFLVVDANNYLSMILFPTARLPQNLTYWFLIRTVLSNALSNTAIAVLSSLIANLLFLALYVFVMEKPSVWSVEKNTDKVINSVLKGVLLVILLFFVTSNTVNEQYLVWTIPFLIMLMISYDSTLKLPFFCLCILDILFLILNVGLNFLSPVISVPPSWTIFQQSAAQWALLISIGLLFSIVTLFVILKLTKTGSTAETMQLASQPHQGCRKKLVTRSLRNTRKKTLQHRLTNLEEGLKAVKICSNNNKATLKTTQ